MSKEPNLVCVQNCYGIDLANIYKSKLEAAEIPVLLQYDSLGPVMGFTVDGLGSVRIMVPEEYASEAESLLQDVAEDTWLDESPDDASQDEVEDEDLIDPAQDTSS